MHPVDAIRSRLRRAGYSLGEWSAGTLFVVELSRDGQLAQATGQGQTQAWQRALRLALREAIAR